MLANPPRRKSDIFGHFRTSRSASSCAASETSRGAYHDRHRLTARFKSLFRPNPRLGQDQRRNWVRFVNFFPPRLFPDGDIAWARATAQTGFISPDARVEIVIHPCGWWCAFARPIAHNDFANHAKCPEITRELFDLRPDSRNSFCAFQSPSAQNELRFALSLAWSRDDLKVPVHINLANAAVAPAEGPGLRAARLRVSPVSGRRDRRTRGEAGSRDSSRPELCSCGAATDGRTIQPDRPELR